MPKSIDFYNGIFSHVIPVHIIASCSYIFGKVLNMLLALQEAKCNIRNVLLERIASYEDNDDDYANKFKWIIFFGNESYWFRTSISNKTEVVWKEKPSD